MTYSIWDAFQSYWNNSGGGGVAYGGTGTGGTITGTPTGGSVTGTYGTDYSDGDTGSDNLGTQDYCSNEPLNGYSFLDENGNLVYVDMVVRAPQLIPGTNELGPIAYIFDRIDYAELQVEIFLRGSNNYYNEHPNFQPEHSRWFYEAIEDHFSPDHIHETGGNKISANFGTDGNDAFAGAGMLLGGVGNDGLTGSAGSDTLDGGSGNDWLNGGAGGDILDGGEGWDVVSYLLTPSANGGITVNLTTNQNSGAAAGDRLYNVEVLQGTNANDTLTGVDRGGHGSELHGEGGNDALSGMAGGDRLYGGDGNDWLDGGAGGDLLDGGEGWDVVTYLLMPASAGGVTVNLTSNANGGAAAGDVLSNIEVVEGTNANDTLTGLLRAGGQGVELSGQGGDDALIGKEGADRLYGGDGNDWFYGDAGADTIDGGAGWDVVSYLSAGSSVVVDLTSNANYGAAAGDRISNVEVVQGTSFNDALTGVDRGGGSGVQLYGEGGNDTLTGKAGGDYLFGGAGNDWLNGDGGSDVLSGGAGADRFALLSAPGAGNVDTIQDFAGAEGDLIVLGRGAFTSLAPGVLSSAAFTLGPVATTPSQHLLYDQGTGALFYDADGSGAQAALKVAMLSAGTALAASQLLVI